MISLTLISIVVFILFISTLTRSTIGFGDALIAMPLLTLVVGVQTATPVVALMGLSIGLLIVGRSWRNIDLTAAWRLVLASMIGIPLGLLLLKYAPEGVVKGILGILLILFGLYALTRPKMPYLHQTNWAYGFGFIAGIFGGAYNVNGPPVVLYGTLRRWSPIHFRATLQGFFLPNVILITLGHALAGLWTAEVIRLYALALPFIIMAIMIGGKLNRRFPAHRFERFLYVALIGLGLLLLI